MSRSANKLFNFIKEQLMDTEHPINKIAANFVYHYVDNYSRELLMNHEQFMHVKE
jgi:hypothetical protein